MHKLKHEITAATIVCFFFFIAYSVLSIVRHLHYGSFGFDLGLTDQVIWKYSQFKAPITTIHYYPFTSLLTDHVELIYILLAPFYWLYNNVLTLLILQTFVVSSSGIAVYLLARKKKLNSWVSYTLLCSYLMFYGIQNALWFDVHSTAFGASFLAWFIYFLDSDNRLWTLITFFLTISSKEDFTLLTCLVSVAYFIVKRKRIAFLLIILSVVYFIAIFYVYFPHFTHDGYRYMSKGNFFQNVFISNFYDSSDKRSVIVYSLSWFGFLPLLSPVFLIPAIGDISHYFFFKELVRAQGLFEQYRITLAPLLILPTIHTLSKYKRLHSNLMAAYIIFIMLFLQYFLHLPLSYLTKSWFWHESTSVKKINTIISFIPSSASVVAQNNIISHISHRNDVFILWPEKKSFHKNSPCKKSTCNWFRWAGKPNYLLIDTASDWDIRHLLANRDDYIDGLHNLEVAGVIKEYKKIDSAVLYSIYKNPNVSK